MNWYEDMFCSIIFSLWSIQAKLSLFSILYISVNFTGLYIEVEHTDELGLLL